MMRTLGAPAEGAGMDCVLTAQHARSSRTPFAHLSSMDPTPVSTLKFHRRGGDTVWQHWLLTKAPWEAAARAAVANYDGLRV